MRKLRPSAVATTAAILAVFILQSQLAYTGEDARPSAGGGPEEKRPGHRMRQKGRQWFFDLPEVQEEIEATRKKRQELRLETRQAIRETLTKKAREEAQQGEGPDEYSIEEQIRRAIKTLMEEQIDELVRHHRAMADILEEHKDKGVEELLDEMEKMLARHHGQHRGHGRGRRGGVRGGDDSTPGEGAEGAVF